MALGTALVLLFLYGFCSCTPRVTFLSGFHGLAASNISDGPNFVLLPSKDFLLFGKVEEGQFNSTIRVDVNISLRQYDCKPTDTFRLRNGFIVECQQKWDGSRHLILAKYFQREWDNATFTVPPDSGEALMNDGVSHVYSPSEQVETYYIYARKNLLCAIGFSEGVESCHNVDPDCDFVVSISSASISDENFVVQCSARASSRFVHFSVAYSAIRAEPSISPFVLPSHERGKLHKSPSWMVFVDPTAVTIWIKAKRNRPVWFPTPNAGTIVQSTMQGSNLLYTVLDSQSMKNPYTTYLLDLSHPDPNQWSPTVLEGDGCIVYLHSLSNQWWLACLNEIRRYHHNSTTNKTDVAYLPWPEGMSYQSHVSYVYPNVSKPPTQPPSPPSPTAGTQGGSNYASVAPSTSTNLPFILNNPLFNVVLVLGIPALFGIVIGLIVGLIIGLCVCWKCPKACGCVQRKQTGQSPLDERNSEMMNTRSFPESESQRGNQTTEFSRQPHDGMSSNNQPRVNQLERHGSDRQSPQSTGHQWKPSPVSSHTSLEQRPIVEVAPNTGTSAPTHQPRVQGAVTPEPMPHQHSCPESLDAAKDLVMHTGKTCAPSTSEPTPSPTVTAASPTTESPLSTIETSATIKLQSTTKPTPIPEPSLTFMEQSTAKTSCRNDPSSTKAPSSHNKPPSTIRPSPTLEPSSYNKPSSMIEPSPTLEPSSPNTPSSIIEPSPTLYHEPSSKTGALSTTKPPPAVEPTAVSELPSTIELPSRTESPTALTPQKTTEKQLLPRSVPKAEAFGEKQTSDKISVHDCDSKKYHTTSPKHCSSTSYECKFPIAEASANSVETQLTKQSDPTHHPLQPSNGDLPSSSSTFEFSEQDRGTIPPRSEIPAISPQDQSNPSASQTRPPLLGSSVPDCVLHSYPPTTEAELETGGANGTSQDTLIISSTGKQHTKGDGSSDPVC